MKKNYFVYLLSACCMFLTVAVFTSCDSDDDDEYTYTMGFDGDVTSSDQEGDITEQDVIDIFMDNLNVSSTTFTKSSDDEVQKGCEAAYKQLEVLNVAVTGSFVVTNVTTGKNLCQISFDSGSNEISFIPKIPDFKCSMGFVGEVVESNNGGYITEKIVLNAFKSALGVNNDEFTTNKTDAQINKCCKSAYDNLRGKTVAITGTFEVKKDVSDRVLFRLYFDAENNSITIL